jgi:hypothetical protein
MDNVTFTVFAMQHHLRVFIKYNKFIVIYKSFLGWLQSIAPLPLVFGVLKETTTALAYFNSTGSLRITGVATENVVFE